VSSRPIKRPLAVLQKYINKEVTVRLKNNMEYRGIMVNVDPYMNIILENAKEYDRDAQVTNYGVVVIRGNNVIFVYMKKVLEE